MNKRNRWNSLAGASGWCGWRSLVCAAGLWLAMAVSGFGEEPAGARGAFRFEAVGEQGLGLWEGDRPVLVYNHGPVKPPGGGGRGRACYFHPVFGLDGEVITDDFPRDHTYHRGMYWAWPHIKIGDKDYELWTARGELQQRFVRFVVQQVSKDGAKLGIENVWAVDEKPVVSEEIMVAVGGLKSESQLRLRDLLKLLHC